MNRNHVFDSNGPDMRLRGTAQQLFEKYLQLGRDATSAGDRVMAESYFQHAEHYFRILNAMNQAAQQQGGPQQQHPQQRRYQNGPEQDGGGDGGMGDQPDLSMPSSGAQQIPINSSGHAIDQEGEAQVEYRDSRGDQRGDSRGDQRGDSRGDPRGDSRGDPRGDSRGDPRGDQRADNRGDPRGDSRGEPQREG